MKIDVPASRENFDLDPPIEDSDRADIQKHIQQMRTRGRKIADITTYLRIEQCNTWHDAYTNERKKMAARELVLEVLCHDTEVDLKVRLIDLVGGDSDVAWQIQLAIEEALRSEGRRLTSGSCDEWAWLGERDQFPDLTIEEIIQIVDNKLRNPPYITSIGNETKRNK